RPGHILQLPTSPLGPSRRAAIFRSTVCPFAPLRTNDEGMNKPPESRYSIVYDGYNAVSTVVSARARSPLILAIFAKPARKIPLPVPSDASPTIDDHPAV